MRLFHATVLCFLLALLLQSSSGGRIGGFLTGLIGRRQQEQPTPLPAHPSQQTEPFQTAEPLQPAGPTSTIPHSTVPQSTVKPSGGKSLEVPGEGRRAINSPLCPDGEIADSAGKCRPTV